MNELKKHALALSLIAILIIIKFLFIPIIDWQNEKQSRLALLERKIAKIDVLMQGKEEISNWKNVLEQQLVNLSNDFYAKQDGEKFKRQQQKLIEAEVKAFNLKMNNIGWKTTIDNPVAPLTQYSVSYSFTGQGTEVINYLLSINAADKYSEIAEFNATFARKYPGQIGRLTIRLRRTFYMNVNEMLTTTEQVEVTT